MFSSTSRNSRKFKQSTCSKGYCFLSVSVFRRISCTLSHFGWTFCRFLLLQKHVSKCFYILHSEWKWQHLCCWVCMVMIMKMGDNNNNKISLLKGYLTLACCWRCINWYIFSVWGPWSHTVNTLQVNNSSKPVKSWTIDHRHFCGIQEKNI